jgi:Sec-independent protein translocase protein TatA
MIDALLAIFEKFPFTKWASIAGVALLFFGDKDFRQIGFWMLVVVGVFMLGLYLLVLEIDESDKEFRRRKNHRD